MAQILIVFGTTQGQTRKIAEVIAEEMRSMQHVVDFFESSLISPNINLEKYDAIVVGASVHSGGYQKSIKNWVKKNAFALRNKKAAFFSVCLGIFENDEKVRNKERKFVQDFLLENNWKPQKTAMFAGALPYSKYNWLVKYWMKRISKKAGGDTDTSHDYEYTNWNEVGNFALEFSQLLINSTLLDHQSRVGEDHLLKT